MHINMNSILKSTRGLAFNAVKFASKNKHLMIEGSLGGIVTWLGIDKLVNSKKGKEKDRLYQEAIKKQDAEIETLKEAVDEADELKKVNEILVDVIEESRRNNGEYKIAPDAS